MTCHVCRVLGVAAFAAVTFLVVTFIILSKLATSSCHVVQTGTDPLTGHGTCVYDFGFGWLTANYTGGLVNGTLDGSGLYRAGDSHYEGGFARNRRDGQGSASLSDGTMIEGGWRANDPHGHAVIRIPATGVGTPEYSFDGAWRQGRLHGRGVLTARKGSLTSRRESAARAVYYDGNFRGGLPDGTGKLVTSDSVEYVSTSRLDEHSGRFLTNLSAIIQFQVNCTLGFSEIGREPSCQVSIRGDRCMDEMEQCAVLRDGVQCLLRFAERALDAVHTVHRSLNYVWHPDNEGRRRGTRPVDQRDPEEL